MSSDYDYDQDETSDEVGKDLSVETDRAINVALAKTLTGEAIKNEDISVNSEYVESNSKEDQTRLLNESVEALNKIASANPQDETDAFLVDYFSKRKWEEKQKRPSQKELDEDNDLEEIDEGIEFEEHYNFHHEEANFDKIQTNPRYVEGEDRVKETSRQRKRRENAGKEKEKEELIQKKLDEIDEKYKPLAEKNGGRLTDEQLHQYSSEYAEVLREQEEGTFKYSEIKADGGIEKSIRILDEDESSESSNDDADDDKNDKNDHKGHHDKNHKGGSEFIRKSGRFNNRGGRGRFDKNQKNKFKGVSNSRMNAYSAHKH